MNRYYRVLGYFTLLIAALIIVGFSHDGNPLKPARASRGFAVVELFTSEGCSSCPAADELVAALDKEHHANVFLLSYHVDYWNRLGWKDVYSDAAYTNRQKRYASAFRLNSLYTPQVVINGKTEFTGSNKIKLHTSVDRELKTETPGEIQLDAKSLDGKTIVASGKANGKGVLHIALVQKQAETAVSGGENRGKNLQHVNVVRDLKTIAATQGGFNNVSLRIPAGLSLKDIKVIAFLQDETDLHITAAAVKEF
jgi:hypothetical protein